MFRKHPIRRSVAPDNYVACLSADAALDFSISVLDSALPSWRLCRLQYDAGVWHCTIARGQAQLELAGDNVTAAHLDPALALVTAVLLVQAEMLHDGGRNQERDAVVVAFETSAPLAALNCDNYR